MPTMSLEPTLTLPITQYIRLIVHLDKIWYATKMKNTPLRERLNYITGAHDTGKLGSGHIFMFYGHMAISFLCLYVLVMYNKYLYFIPFFYYKLNMLGYTR